MVARPLHVQHTRFGQKEMADVLSTTRFLVQDSGLVALDQQDVPPQAPLAERRFGVFSLEELAGLLRDTTNNSGGASY